MQKNNVTRGFGLLEGLLAKKRAKLANKLIHDNMRIGSILDIGCGSYPYFLSNTEFATKYGIDKVVDSNPNIQKELGINLMNHDFENEDLLPFDNDYFNVITMLAVFEHIEPIRIPIVLNEIFRTLKPGGIFILTTPAIWTDKLLRFLAKVRLVSPLEIEEHKDAYNFDKIKNHFEKTNFNLDNIKLGYFEMYMNIWGFITK